MLRADNSVKVTTTEGSGPVAEEGQTVQGEGATLPPTRQCLIPETRIWPTDFPGLCWSTVQTDEQSTGVVGRRSGRLRSV